MVMTICLAHGLGIGVSKGGVAYMGIMQGDGSVDVDWGNSSH